MSCVFEGVEYSEGSLVCANGRELVCRNDEWHENGESCTDQTTTSKEGDEDGSVLDE
jgi:hypothetical protein